MPGGILDNNDYVEEQALQRGQGGGRGGQGGGPGGTFGGGFGGGGFGGFGYQPGGFGSNPQMRRLQVAGPRGPVPVTFARPGFGAQGPMAAPQAPQGQFSGAPSPKGLNQAAGASGGIRGMLEGLARDIGRRNGTQGGGAGGYSPGGELEQFQNEGDPRALANWLLSQYQNAGNFGPGGNPAIIGAMQDSAARQGNQASQRAQLSADVSGMDPAQAAAYRARTDVASNTASQQGMQEAMLQQLLGRQQFGDNLFGNMLGHSYGWDSADQRGALDRRAASEQRPSALGQWGSLLGTIGGTMLGGPMGGAIGGGLGGTFGGGGGSGGSGGYTGAWRPALPQAY